MIKKELTITNETGLHARPASELVKNASSFVSNIQILIADKVADAKSIINILSLGLRKGDVITLTVDGIDEKDAFDHLEALFASGFGEA